MATAFSFYLELLAELSDGDKVGLHDDWETLNGLSPVDNGSVNIDNGPDGDPDLDGISNRIEWLVGLNPQVVDNSAYPKLTINKIPGGMRFTFPTIGGRMYRLQSSGALDGWQPFGQPHVTPRGAQPGQLEIDDTTGLPSRFYRMSIAPAP